MADESVTVEQVLALLGPAPARIVALTDGLLPAQLRTRPAPDEWSANDVLAHLRACADVWGGCIATILAEDNTTIRAVDPRTWMTHTNYPELEFRPSLEVYAAQRATLMAVLGTLTPAAWSREATMTGAGKPIRRSVLGFSRRLAIHERPHLKQIARVAEAMRI